MHVMPNIHHIHYVQAVLLDSATLSLALSKKLPAFSHCRTILNRIWLSLSVSGEVTYFSGGFFQEL